MEEKDKIKLEEMIEKLEKIRGRHTELISVYIPAGFNINQVAKQLEAEKSTASNIKSKSTQKAVLNSLETIIRELKLYKQTPENGMAVFAGNVSEKEGQEDIQSFAIEPPKPMKTRLYRCDQTFVLEPLQEMLKVDEVYGLVVMDRKEATFGLLEGKQIKVLRKMTSGVPGKVRAGGQSSQRIHRLTEGMAKEFFRRIADNMKELYFELPKLKGIIIGGPLPTKEDFMEEGNLVTALKEKVIGMIDIGYTDESGLGHLVDASHEIIASQEIIHEKKVLEDFFDKLGKDPKKTLYKEKDIEHALQYGAVQKLLISKKYNKESADNLSDKASEISAEVELISDETEEGKQFFNLGGIGAILRFEV